MSKRSISYTKPPEPSFIKKMKDAIGYQEPDTVETKVISVYFTNIKFSIYFKF